MSGRWILLSVIYLVLGVFGAIALWKGNDEIFGEIVVAGGILLLFIDWDDI